MVRGIGSDALVVRNCLSSETGSVVHSSDARHHLRGAAGAAQFLHSKEALT